LFEFCHGNDGVGGGRGGGAHQYHQTTAHAWHITVS